MDTNKSKFTEVDLREVRKERDYSISDKENRKQNRELRATIKKRTRSREKQAFDKILRDGDYEDVHDFWRK